MNPRLRRVLIRLRCALIGHDDVKAHIGTQLVAACADCQRVTVGVDVTPRALRFVNPERREWWRAYWLDHLRRLHQAVKAGAV